MISMAGGWLRGRKNPGQIEADCRTLFGLDGTTGNPIPSYASGDLTGDGLSDIVIGGWATACTPHNQSLNIMVLKHLRMVHYRTGRILPEAICKSPALSYLSSQISMATAEWMSASRALQSSPVTFVPSTFYLSKQGGGFSKVVYPKGSAAVASAVADINGDGISDAVTSVVGQTLFAGHKELSDERIFPEAERAQSDCHVGRANTLWGQVHFL